MKLAHPFFVLAREILAVPAGATEHPGIMPDKVAPLAARIEAHADLIEALLPKSAANLRATADRLCMKCRMVGLSRAETFQLGRYLAQVGGMVAATEPEDA